MNEMTQKNNNSDRTPTIRQIAEQWANHVPADMYEGWYQRELEAFGQAVVVEVERDVADFVASRDFYELMQVYRHTPCGATRATVYAFEAVKDAIKVTVRDCFRATTDARR